MKYSREAYKEMLNILLHAAIASDREPRGDLNECYCSILDLINKVFNVDEDMD